MAGAARAVRPALVGVGLAVVVLGGVACSDDDSGAFCDRLGDTEQLGDVLNSLDTSDPASVETEIEAAFDEYAELEAAAPGEIRDDVARVRQGVELVLDAVRDNPDDLPAAREQIAGQIDELAGLVTAGDNLVRYASDECDINLVPVGVDEDPTDGEDGSTTTEG